ncbi:hypothetical protein BDV98DRAFT_576601 [Pterulicium gracile]|uniref:Secreted protein n=1 Tax=Pterulicium gracile TaxID=1884261 RepID=A0A5C3Q1X5_9AGAR|nr:hypothetical protein BDV98DRAFT_576601 [Pterula gracilis]
MLTLTPLTLLLAFTLAVSSAPTYRRASKLAKTEARTDQPVRICHDNASHRHRDNINRSQCYWLCPDGTKVTRTPSFGGIWGPGPVKLTPEQIAGLEQ